MIDYLDEQKKKQEGKAKEKELNDLFKVAASQPKVPVGMCYVVNLYVCNCAVFCDSCLYPHFLCMYMNVLVYFVVSLMKFWTFLTIGVDPKSILCEFFKVGQCT